MLLPMPELTDHTLHLDGYRANCDFKNNQYQLQLQAIANAEPLQDPVIVTRFPDTETGRADAHRALGLLAAVCRFRNAGGTAQQLASIIQTFDWTVDSGALPQLDLPENVSLFLMLTDNDYIFRLPDNHYLRVVDEEFTEELSEPEVIQLLEEEACA